MSKALTTALLERYEGLAPRPRRGSGWTLFTLRARALHYIGFVRDGEPADPPTDARRINSLLDLATGALPAACTQVSEICDRVGSTLDVSGFADATASGAFQSSGGSPSATGIDVTGWTYLLGKYDGPSFGDLIWYVGGLTGPVDIQLYGLADKYRLSHYALFNKGTTTKVPEPAALTLLSVGLLGIGFVRRRRRA